MKDITRETEAMAAAAEALLACTLASRTPAVALTKLVVELYNDLGPAAAARVLQYLAAHAAEAELQAQRRRDREAEARAQLEARAQYAGQAAADV